MKISKSSTLSLVRVFLDVFSSIVLELIRSIRHPEYPYTIEQLDMVNSHDIQVESKFHINLFFSQFKIDKRTCKVVKICWKPSTPNCRFATHTGLALYLKLEREFRGSGKIKFDFIVKSEGHRQYQLSKHFKKKNFLSPF